MKWNYYAHSVCINFIFYVKNWSHQYDCLFPVDAKFHWQIWRLRRVYKTTDKPGILNCTLLFKVIHCLAKHVPSLCEYVAIVCCIMFQPYLVKLISRYIFIFLWNYQIYHFQFESDSSPGVVLFMYSLILSRTFNK